MSSADTMRRKLGSSSMMRISPFGVISARYRASPLPGARNGGFAGALPAAFARMLSGARSDNNLVVNRCPSEMRSTSSATESMACSIRVSRSTRSLGRILGSIPCAMRLAYALASGTPTQITATIPKKLNGTRTSGPTDRLLQRRLCRRLVDRKHEANLRARTRTARRIHASAVRQHCLSRDRQPQPRTSRFVCHVRIPDPCEMFRRDPAPSVPHSQLHRVARCAAAVEVSARHVHLHVASLTARVHRIDQHVRQRASEGIVMSRHQRNTLVDVHVYRYTIRGNRTSRVSRQLAHVHRCRRPLWESSELREVARHLLQPA